MQASNTKQAGRRGQRSRYCLGAGSPMNPLPLMHGAIPAPQSWMSGLMTPQQGKRESAGMPPSKLLQGCAPCTSVHDRFYDALMEAVDAAVNMAQVLNSPNY
jgi:hypothetical protein